VASLFHVPANVPLKVKLLIFPVLIDIEDVLVPPEILKLTVFASETAVGVIVRKPVAAPVILINGFVPVKVFDDELVKTVPAEVVATSILPLEPKANTPLELEKFTVLQIAPVAIVTIAPVPIPVRSKLTSSEEVGALAVAEPPEEVDQ